MPAMRWQHERLARASRCAVAREQQAGLAARRGYLAKAMCWVMQDPAACSLTDQLMSIPGWDFLLINSAEDARAQAAWLQSLNRNGHPCLPQPRTSSADSSGAGCSKGDPIRTIPNGQFCQTSLLNELIAPQECPTPTIETTPQPAGEMLWEHRDHSESRAAVSLCISLYNYSHTILRALESVRRQTLGTDPSIWSWWTTAQPMTEQRKLWPG